MFMKHTISRFFRFFLVAALVAAMAGSLLPSKALAQDAGTVTVEVSDQRAGAVAEFVITLANSDYTANVHKVTVEFSDASVPSNIDRSDISVANATEASLLTAAPTVSGSTLSFFTPVNDPITIVISNSAGVRNSNSPAAAAKVTVNGEDSNTYSVNQYLNVKPGSAARNATVTVTGGGFSAGTSGVISLYDDGIRGVSDYIIVEDADGPNLDTEDSPMPTLTGATIVKSITLPVDSDTSTAEVLDLSDEDIAKGVMMRPHPAPANDGDPCPEDDALELLVTGEADQGMERACNDDDDVAPSTKGTGGEYTVDSSGALSGSFVAISGTAGGGVAQVVDLGSGETIRSGAYSQKASVTPASMQAALGSTLSIALTDFTAGSTFTATIANDPIDGFDETVNDDQSKASLTIAQTEGTGTKRVAITGTVMVSSGIQDIQDTEDGGTGPNGVDEAADMAQTQTASFLITIVSRSLAVSPSLAVPGQAVTVSGSGFAAGTVNLTLEGVAVDRGTGITVNTDGSFLYTGRVPFNADTESKGSKEWTAAAPDGSRAASSTSFAIQARTVTLSPSTANPGATVEVSGSGWGVTTSEDGDENSEVTLDVTDTTASFGPFPISSSGEFTGAFTVPADAGVSKITVTATDNNGDLVDEDSGYDSQSKSATLTVPTGVISVNPDTASTGTVITVTGNGFPAQTNLSALTFGDGNALPVPAPATDVTGNFTVTLTVPAAARGGSLPPGAVVITARVGQISGTTSFTIPGPSITLSTASAAPGQMITVTGTNFGAYAGVATINVGQQNQAPTPNPLTDAVGNFSSNVLIPALNPGAYTITVRTAAAFTATHPINIVSPTAGGVSPEIAFQALTSRGLLRLAAAAAPGGTEFGAYVPGLAGNTLVQVDPNGVLILTLNADARISVSNQPAVDVAADTPTFFALGANVSVEVIE